MQRLVLERVNDTITVTIVENWAVRYGVRAASPQESRSRFATNLMVQTMGFDLILTAAKAN